MSRDHERVYGKGYVIIPLRGDSLNNFNSVIQQLSGINGISLSRNPHITILDLGLVPAYKVPEVEQAVRERVDELSDCTLFIGGGNYLGSRLCLDVQQQVEARRMNRTLRSGLVEVLHCPRMDYQGHVTVATVVGRAPLNSYRDRVKGIFDEVTSKVDIDEVDILLKYPSPGLHSRIIRIQPT
jgi:2'-5' RNA ligase